MAKIIPEESITNSHPGAQLYFCLKALDDNFICRQQLTTSPELTGLRYWIKHDKQSLLLATLPDKAISDEIELDKEQLAKHPLVVELVAERNALFPESLQNHAHRLLPIVLLLQDNLGAKQTIHNKASGVLAIGGILISGAMQAVVKRCSGIPASEQVDRIINARFSPEALISKDVSDESPKDLKLLDLQQEISLKKGLFAKPSSPYSFNVVTGMAGSGKSEVLVKRAALLLQHAPQSRILILSHNKSISNALKQSLCMLARNADAIQCLPFYEWCRKLLGGTWRFVYDDQETELFDLMIKRHFKHEALSRTGLIREINFIKDRRIETESDYLRTIRSSNSLALSTEIRKRIWQAMVDIDTHLRDRKSSLWGDAPGQLLTALEEGKTVERYTHILIDEGQYFAPVWFKLITTMLAPQGDLFITADPDQGFLNRSIDAAENELPMDNTESMSSSKTQLTHHYRCSPAISMVVDKFCTHRSMDSSKQAMYSIKQPGPIDPEDQPQLLHFPTKEDQQNRLFSVIHQLTQEGYSPSDILIINADIQSTRMLAQDIRDMLNIRATAMTGSMIIDDTTLKLCDITGATGLQSKIVLITGLEYLFDAEQSVELSDRERHSLKTDNTRLLHMAMTRASERLYLLISTAEVPESLIIDGLDAPTLSKEFLAPVRYLNP